MRDYRLFLKDILGALDAIEKFIGEMGFEEFTADDKTVSAVIRKFEIVGEAAKNLPDFIKAKYPGVPWKDMAGLRDRLIHGYFGVDFKIVWDTIKKDIPVIKPKIHQILDEMEADK